MISTRNWKVIATVPTPADLVAKGYKPHDVFVSGHQAFVSLLGGGGNDDYVIRFSTHSFKETGRIAVGQDPHLWVDRWTRRLFVAAQGADSVEVFNTRSLRSLREMPAKAAHGIYIPKYSRNLLVTNISGGGTDGLLGLPRFGRRSHGKGLVIDTPKPVPHNIAASAFGRRIFVTHSGATSTAVSVYTITGWGRNRKLKLLTTATAGTNPFGLAVVY